MRPRLLRQEQLSYTPCFVNSFTNVTFGGRWRNRVYRYDPAHQ